MKLPGPDHPISLSPCAGEVVVTCGGAVIARSRRAIVLQETTYPTVYYIPRDDLVMERLARSDTRTHCPYKGDAAYFSMADAGAAAVDIAWSYEAPFPAMAAIAGHLAFYPNRVDAIAVGP